MAEKEERIAIVKWNIKDSICPAPAQLQCGGAKSCVDCKVGMSRADAINRIANRLRTSTLLMDSDPEVYAEAALNALLEEGK